MNLITVIVFVQVIAVVWNITVVDFNLQVHFVSHNTSEVADHVVVCAGNYLRNGTYRDCEYLNDIVKLEANRPTNVTLSAKGIWPTHPWFLVLSFRLHRVDDSSVYLRKIEFSRIYNVTAISQYASIDLTSYRILFVVAAARWLSVSLEADVKDSGTEVIDYSRDQ
uniref:Secreted protein n=1 Tax=Heterorhabditis bacteriophora TaxID=37862 RepID=A0A1I7XN15_HETBA